MLNPNGYSEQDFAAKVEWEGGVIESLVYGLRSGDLANQASPLADAWYELETAWERMRPLITKVEVLLPDEEEEEDSPPLGS